jgi:hypothetical protein
MHASKGANGAAYFRNVVLDFRDAERESSTRLTLRERNKVGDLLNDVKFYDCPLWWAAPLSVVFEVFEWGARITSPYFIVHPLGWAQHKFRNKHRLGRKPIDCHPSPENRADAAIAFADDFYLFDHLSKIYGGQFRGSIVFNYVLGIAASGTLVYTLTMGHPRPFASAFELVCLLIIGAIYLKGVTPEVDEKKPAFVPRWAWQRWHQRWLEYRLVAERFRYLDLLLPFGTDKAVNTAIASGENADQSWYQRYFQWRIGTASTPDITTREYHQHVIAVMIAQERYHALNYMRRGSISDGLHAIAIGLFIFGLACCFANLGVEYFTDTPRSVSPVDPDFWRGLILFSSAMAPVLSAAIHGILANTEYTKVADTSGEVAQRIHELVDELSAMPVPDDWDSEKSTRPMRNAVQEFVGLVINEATGWRAMLRDKNVPLA